GTASDDSYHKYYDKHCRQNMILIIMKEVVRLFFIETEFFQKHRQLARRFFFHSDMITHQGVVRLCYQFKVILKTRRIMACTVSVTSLSSIRDAFFCRLLFILLSLKLLLPMFFQHNCILSFNLSSGRLLWNAQDLPCFFTIHITTAPLPITHVN